MDIKSYVTKKTRKGVGAWAGKNLVYWLNDEKRTPAHKRIEELLDTLRLVQSYSSRTPTAKQQAAFHKLQGMLSKYRMCPQIYHANIGKRGMHIHWKTVDRKDEAAKFILVIVWLGERGLVWKLRRCHRCRRWFYARGEEHIYDTTACRVAEFSKKPEVKAQRAEYMRKRREREAEQEKEYFAGLGRKNPKRKAG